MLTIVGDAVAKPLLDVWDAAEPGRWDASSLFAISNGGAPLSAGGKARILERFPDVLVTDGFGSSEAGIQGSSRSEEHTSELQSLMRISYAVFCLKKKNIVKHIRQHYNNTNTPNILV